jgi:ribulose-phosphate 3-epimerase
LGDQVAEAEAGGADMIHIDIMDGHFVPNLTFGSIVVKSIRNWTSLPFDLHIMMAEPDAFIPEFAKSGADSITVHAEACTHLHKVVQQIKEEGKRASVAISPATPISAVEEILDELDQVLVMTVNPGFGGQAFIESVVPKIARMRALIDERGLKTDLQVDGGISVATANTVAQAGANVLVAGSAVYNKDSTVAESIKRIRDSIR